MVVAIKYTTDVPIDLFVVFGFLIVSGSCLLLRLSWFFESNGPYGNYNNNFPGGQGHPGIEIYDVFSAAEEQHAILEFATKLITEPWCPLHVFRISQRRAPEEFKRKLERTRVSFSFLVASRSKSNSTKGIYIWSLPFVSFPKYVRNSTQGKVNVLCPF